MYNQKQSDRLRADAKRRIIAEYKISIGCIDCGYNADARALEFDHLSGTVKLRTVASLMYQSWEEIWREINKCELVCANCHAIRTFKRKAL